MTTSSSGTQSRWAQVLRIATWEFKRFVKWRQQAIGIAIMIVLSAVSGTVTKMVQSSRGKETRVAVVGAERLGFPLPSVEGIRFDAVAYTTETAARSAVADDSIGGALVVRSGTVAEVLVRKKAAWTGDVERALATARQAAMFGALPLDAQQRAELFAPFAVKVSTVTLTNGGTDTSTTLLTGAVLMFGLLVLLNGFTSLFAGITGEKQQRITEQIIAIVSPQTWMDGKILGLAGAAIAGTLLFLITAAAVVKVLPSVLGTREIPFPGMPSELLLVMTVVAVTLLGIVMWFAFMAAIAATIDDPNASPRSSLLFIPMLPMGLAFSLISRPETPIAQLLSMFPLTSMAVLPVRMLLTSVPWWEPVAAVLLLAATAWAFRRAAGVIFAVGILMHGKEPSVAEIWRWVRKVG